MYFVNKESSSSHEEKKSKFIAHIAPFSQYDQLMKRLKEEHPKARHFVYAYRYLNEFDQIVENSSDDGEPKGTSGKPSLAVLAGKEMINCAVIIVRYFGGVKLGTGGLVRAYADAVNLVINNSKLIKYEKLQNYTLEVDYSSLSKIEYILNSFDVKITDKKFDSMVSLSISATDNQLEQLKENLPRDIELKHHK
jgi:uncharacterized YigZ family protein